MENDLMNPVVNIGDRLLRRKTGDGEQWVEFIINKTYMELIKEFPDDYRKLNGDRLDLVINHVTF